MLRITRLLAALMLLFAAAASSSRAYAADATVGMELNPEQNPEGGFIFTPETITVNVGDTVTWSNTTQAPHTSTSDDGVWDSGNIAPGETYSFTFEEAGTYGYFCAYHEDQVGTVVVQAAAGGDEQDGDEGDTGGDEGDTGGDEGDTDGGDTGDTVGDTGNEGEGDEGETPEEMPDSGAGAMAGSGAPVIGNLVAMLSLLLASGFALLRNR